MQPYGSFHKRIYFFLGLAVLLFLTGCSNDKTPELPTEKMYEDFAPVTEIKEGQRNIYLVLKSFTSRYWQQIIRGASDAGEALDCNVYLGGTYYETGYEYQELLMDEAFARGADAILLAPIDSTLEVNTVREIRNGGTPVILIDTILNSDDYDVCLMTDNLQAGELAAQEMLRQMQSAGVSIDSPAQIAIQVGSTGSQTIVDRLAGFSQYWSQYAPPSWTVIDDVMCNNGDLEVATQFCSEYLENYPDLKGVFGCNNGSTVGFARGLLENERRDVVIVGFDYSDEIAGLISSGQCPASTIVQRQYDMGYLGVGQAIDILNGQDIDLKFIDTGVCVVNSENIDDPDIQKILSYN